MLRLPQVEASYSEELIDNSVALAQKSFVKRYKIPKKKTTEDDDGEDAEAHADARADVRQKAAWALGQLDELTTAPPALIEALRDEDRNVRLGAAHALGEIEDAPIDDE